MLMQARLTEARWIVSGDGSEVPRGALSPQRRASRMQKRALILLRRHPGVIIPVATFFQMVYGYEMGTNESHYPRLVKLIQRLRVRNSSGEWTVDITKSGGVIGRM